MDSFKSSRLVFLSSFLHTWHAARIPLTAHHGCTALHCTIQPLVWHCLLSAASECKAVIALLPSHRRPLQHLIGSRSVANTWQRRAHNVGDLRKNARACQPQAPSTASLAPTLPQQHDIGHKRTSSAIRQVSHLSMLLSPLGQALLLGASWPFYALCTAHMSSCSWQIVCGTVVH